jgi:hypothetical protein
MKKSVQRYLTGATLMLLATPALMAQVILVEDNFENRNKLIDNTLLLNWGTYGSPQTGFSLQTRTDASSPTPLTFNTIALTDSGVRHSGYTAANSLKTLTSIDYQLPITLNRAVGDIKIEFDGIWNGQDNGGESGRMVVTLMGSYPAGGARFDEVYDTTLDNPFGQPLYNIRIRNTSGSNGPLMLYGAGNSTHPEWEIYGTAPGWWLPGFSVQAGGGSPGSGPDYPASGTKKSPLATTSTTIWRHYTWIIKPERLELYYRNSNQPASSDILIGFMQTPSTSDPVAQLAQINAAHGTSATQLPPFYQYYNNFNAVRFYWRGAVNSHLANVRISQSGVVLAFEQLVLQQPQRRNGAIQLPAIVRPAQTTERKVTLQHSGNGQQFTDVATVTVPAGSTNTLLHHPQPLPGINYYRLAQRGDDGNLRYSNTVSLQGHIPPVTWSVGGNRSIQLHIPEPLVGQALTVWDMNGKVLLTQKTATSTVILSNSSSGALVYRIGEVTGRVVL